MIRTAILAGLLLVMLSIAYSKSTLPGMTPAPVAARIDAPPPSAPEPVMAPAPKPARAESPKPAPAAREVATVRQNLLPSREPERVTALPAPEPVVQEPPAAAAVAPPVVAKLPPAPEPVQEPPVAAPVAPPVVATLPSGPVVLQPPKEPEYLPAIPGVDKPLPLTHPAVTPLEDMPVREVATPRVMMPRELPLPSERQIAMPRDSSPAIEAPVEAPLSEAQAFPTKAAPASPSPQLMSREERTRELYRLARDMEDTFIEKLAH